MANLIVSEKPAAAGLRSQRDVARLFSFLRPYGGTACFDLAADSRDRFVRAVESAQLPGAELDDRGSLVLLRRQGPLPGSASWTHETADSARSYFSKDQLVKAPLGVLWYGDGADYGFYKSKDYGVGVKPQVVGGRLFAYQIFSRTLHAVDVYTGRALWKTKVEHFTRYASMEDGIYVAGGDTCLVLSGVYRETVQLHKCVAGYPMPRGHIQPVHLTDHMIARIKHMGKENSLISKRSTNAPCCQQFYLRAWLNDRC